MCNRRPRHFRLRELRDQQLRAVLHQLCQREPPAVFRAAHLQDGAGGVQPGGHQLAAHRVRRQPGGPGPHRRQADEHHGPGRRGVQVSQGERLHVPSPNSFKLFVIFLFVWGSASNATKQVVF